MGIYRSQTIFPFFTNIPRDVWTNTMHWVSDDSQDDEAVAAEIDLRLFAFYNTIYDSSVFYAAPYVNWDGIKIEVTNLGDAPPRIPIIRDMPLSEAEGTTNLPTEVACVLSYHAAPQSGVIRQRLHNRIYLGGLANPTIDNASTSSFPVFDPGFLTVVAGAAAALLADNTAALEWRQYSAAGGLITMREIVGGWVDDSPDTQRRRSVDATSRTLWS